MFTGIIAIIALISIAMKWQKPILAAGVYSLIRITVLLVHFFILQRTELSVGGKIATIMFVFVVSFLVGWLMTWLLVKFREKTWATVACVPLALILLIF